MRSLWVSVLAGSVLVVSGCGGGAKPPEAAPPSSPASPSASPSESGTPDAPVTLPAEVQGTSTESAVATARLFIDEVNGASTDGDTTLLRMLFVPSECENCTAISELIEQTYREGGRIVGGTWEDVQLGRPVRGTEGQMGVPVKVTGADQRVVPAAGEPEELYEGGLRTLQDYTLVKSEGRWKIVTLNIQELT